jgi:threonine dehydratase
MGSETTTNYPEYDVKPALREVAAVLEAIDALPEDFYRKDVFEPTPLHTRPNLLRGHQVFTKREDLHPEVGAFKARGARAAVMHAIEDEPGLVRVVTASAGNFGLGVAHAAAQMGLEAWIYCRTDVSPVKAERLKELGAKVVDEYDSLETALAEAADAGELPESRFLHPFDEYAVIAGNATAIMETFLQLEQSGTDLREEPVTLLVPGGGGGFAAAAASVVWAMKERGELHPDSKVLVAQMENCNALQRACTGDAKDNLFAEGEFDPTCDGAAVTRPGTIAQRILSDPEFIGGFITISKAEVGEAMHELDLEFGVTAEPAGALSRAAANRLTLGHNASLPGHASILVTFLSGANRSVETWSSFNRAVLEAQNTAAEYEVSLPAAVRTLGRSACLNGPTRRSDPVTQDGDPRLVALLQQMAS